jgi:hypothetical protein
MEFPQFYYSGSKHHGLKPDVDWIEWQLKRLTISLRGKAAVEYQNLYLRHLGKTKPNDARTVANKFLLEFANEHGVSAVELRKKMFGVEVSEDTKTKADSMAARMKGAIQRKTILGMVEDDKKRRG